MKVAWASKGFPPVCLVSGDNDFLRKRFIKHLLSEAVAHGYQVEFVETDSDLTSAMGVAKMFGQPTICVIPHHAVSENNLQGGVLVECVGTLDEKKFPIFQNIPASCRINFPMPEKKQDLERMAVQFFQQEMDRLIQVKGVVDTRLAEAVVTAVGSDLGMLSFEAMKMGMLLRAQGKSTLRVDDVRGVVRGAREAELQPVRDALLRADAVAMAKALQRLYTKADGDPTMLLLRAKGGPADMAYQWLQVCLLMKKGVDSKGIANMLNIPEWSLNKDILAVVNRWGIGNIRYLLEGIAQVDRGLLRGIPNPRAACEGVLIGACHCVAR